MANSWLMTKAVCLNLPPLHGGRTHPSTYPLRLRLPPKAASLKSSSTSIHKTALTSPPSRRPHLVVPSHLFNNDNTSLHYPYRLLDLKHLKPNDQTEYYISAGAESRRRRYPWDKESLFPDDARYIGSSHGWLAVVHPRTFQMFLFNPIDPEQIVPLPPLETLNRRITGGCVAKSNYPSSPSPLAGNYFTGGIYGTRCYDKRFSDQSFMSDICFPHKIIMSSGDVTASNCVIMAVNPINIAVCKPGDTAWTVLPNQKCSFFTEAIYSDSEECFFVTENLRGTTWVEAWELSDFLDRHNLAVRWDQMPKNQLRDLSDPLDRDDHDDLAVWWDQMPKNLIRDSITQCYKGDQSYLVESSFGENENDNEKDILLVERYLLDYAVECHHRTVTFDVYRLNWDEMVWEPVECLGDQALFIGFNHCVSVLVCHDDDDDDENAIKPNCIYFTDDSTPGIYNYEYGGCDIGVFDLKENKIDRYHFGDPEVMKKIHPPPVWFFPH